MVHQISAAKDPQQQTLGLCTRSILHRLHTTKANISRGKSIKAKEVPTAKLTGSETLQL